MSALGTPPWLARLRVMGAITRRFRSLREPSITGPNSVTSGMSLSSGVGDAAGDVAPEIGEGHLAKGFHELLLGPAAHAGEVARHGEPGGAAGVGAGGVSGE